MMDVSLSRSMKRWPRQLHLLFKSSHSIPKFLSKTFHITGFLTLSSFCYFKLCDDHTLGMTLRTDSSHWFSFKSSSQTCPTCGINKNFIADTAEKVLDSVVNLKVIPADQHVMKPTSYTSGSGVVIDDDGLILTNAHVVLDAQDGGTIIVTTHSSEELNATLLSMDKMSDLALLRANSKPMKSPWKKATLASNQHLRHGDWVIAIGSPLGLQHTVTVGVVSSHRRKSLEIGAIESPVEYIQTDCTIHSGSSGGPLVNISGEVIGIITTRAEGEGISFAIRIDNAFGIIQQMLTHGRVIRPWIGVQMMSLTPKLIHEKRSMNDFHYPETINKGVWIDHVISDSPADEAGLCAGDVIMTVDEFPVSSTQEILRIVGLRVNESIRVSIARMLPLEQDWDGRIMRYEMEFKDTVIIAKDLEDFLSSSKRILDE